MFSGKRNITFPNNTKKVIFQRYFFGKTILSGRLEKENMVFRAVKHFIRYYDGNKMMIVPLQLKINNFYNELNTLANNNRVMLIYNDDKEFFIKCREIWNKIIELIGISNPTDFVEADDDDDKLFIMADVHENTKTLFLMIIIDMDIIKL